ncbi:zinc ribbon domain-containing protein [Dictyobacter kobayashii]|uniref:Zinc-ribbon domain-containing protein n=1 Tax=Dictyobacter kobayashii TaxID=2014872 RepID=A0A402ADK9_9CHLR|nr:zinc ribbon domain-containing protein [Dictyobacter kobayashii]GCE17185.1 hypothetical protein KDK_09850 [Dictyobacter kobayashii]
MAQASPRYCPRCGAETDLRQRFCARCGLSIKSPAERAQQIYSPRPQPAVDDADMFSPQYQAAPAFQERFPAQPLDNRPIQDEDDFAPSQPRYSARSRRRRPGWVGLLLLALALLLILGVALYFILPLLGIGKATQASISTSDLQTTINYAGTDILLQNVQQANNFLDDPATRSDGMVRLHVQATNKGKNSTTLIYPNIAHVLLPGGKEVPVLYASSNPTLAAGETQVSNLDFAVPASIKADQLVFRLGASTEARMDIPLKMHADVGQYAPKSIDLNKDAGYLSLDYQLTQASTQWSLDGQQAPKGMRYLTLTFKVNNPLTQSVIAGSPFDYMQVKAGAMTTQPQQADMPVTLAAHVQNQAGTAVFLVPQDANAMTLLLGTKDGDGFDPGTVDFTF